MAYLVCFYVKNVVSKVAVSGYQNNSNKIVTTLKKM